MKNGAEPAFASATSTVDGHTFHQNGLTKRELISTMCLKSIIANYNCVTMDVKTKSQHAKEAIKWADALLLELSKERE